MYLSTLNESANYLKVYIDEGIKDGSISTQYSKELEFISLMMNMWLGLNIISFSLQELEERLYFLKNLLESINIPLIDDSIISATLRLHDYIQKRK